jgi:hypothetical protein
MRTRTLSLFVLCLLAGLAFAASAKEFCFDFGEWRVDRSSGTGTWDFGDQCDDGTSNVWSVSGTIDKTGKKEYDLDLTATNPRDSDPHCGAQCGESYTFTGHFSHKTGSGTFIHHTCAGPVSGPWAGIKHRCQ